MDRKNVPVSSVRGLNDADGIVEAIVSVTNIVDSVNDVIEPGAYKNTLRKRNPKGVWSHDTNIPVAKTIKVEELLPDDSRLPEDLRAQNAGALLVKMQFNLNTSRGRDAFYDVQFFAEEQEWSIGYSVPEGKSTTDEKTGVRFIKALELYEYSPVIFGAAPNTRTLSVKDDLTIEEEKASPEDVMVGTPVSYSVPKPPDRAQSAHGIVEKVTRSGEVRLPNTSETLEATSDDPVVTIRVYAILEDGSHQRTDRRVMKNVSDVRVIEDFRQDEKEYAEYEEKAGKYDDLDFRIPSGVKKQAQMGLEMSQEYNRGGTSVGKNTARYLIKNSVAGPEKVRHIARYFPRHEVDLRTPANSKPGADGYPGAGLIAWKLWGGDAGRTWSSKLVEAMNRRDEKQFNVENLEEKAPLSARVQKALRKKVADHNEKYGDSAGKRATYSMLAASFRRGIGAYRTNPGSVRPNVTGPEQWAMARVNGLLYALRTGRFRRTAYDTDLLPSAHPLSSRKDIYTDMPEGSPGSFGTPYRPGVVGRPGARRPRRRRPAEGKPYRISSNMSGCGGYAVVKEGEDSPVPGGCHDTLAEARRHMAALYAAEKAQFETIEQKHIGHRFLLSAEEAALHESLLQIATVYGKFDEDGSGIYAAYDSPAENDVKDIGVKCSNCTLYKGGGVCSIIKQTVQEEGKCRFAVIPDGVVKVDGTKSYAEAITEWEESEEGADWEAIESKAGGPIRSHSTAVRDDTPINRSAILAVRSPESPSYFRKIFAYQLPNTDGTRKTHYTFIHHHISKDGQAGAAAMGELRVQMSVLNGARGGTVLRGADRKAVYNHLAKHYRDGGFEVPSLKSDHEVDNLMIKAGYITEPLTKEEVND